MNNLGRWESPGRYVAEDSVMPPVKWLKREFLTFEKIANVRFRRLEK